MPGNRLSGGSGKVVCHRAAAIALHHLIQHKPAAGNCGQARLSLRMSSRIGAPMNRPKGDGR
jgi:hypothetical protein